MMLVIRKVRRGMSLEMTAEALEDEPERLKLLYDLVKAAGPDYDAEEIYRQYAALRHLNPVNNSDTI